MSQRLNLLARHHSRLLEIMGTARPLITSSAERADLVALRHLRREMVEALAAYQRFVHEEIFEPARTSGSRAARADAQELKIGCIDIQVAYDAFGIRWSRRNALESWSEYRLSSIRMMKRVRDHIRQVQSFETNWALAA